MAAASSVPVFGPALTLGPSCLLYPEQAPLSAQCFSLLNSAPGMAVSSLPSAWCSLPWGSGDNGRLKLPRPDLMQGLAASQAGQQLGLCVPRDLCSLSAPFGFHSGRELRAWELTEILVSSPTVMRSTGLPLPHLTPCARGS